MTAIEAVGNLKMTLLRKQKAKSL